MNKLNYLVHQTSKRSRSSSIFRPKMTLPKFLLPLTLTFVTCLILCPAPTYSKRFNKLLPGDHDLALQKSVRDPKMMYLPFIKVVVPPEPCGNEQGTIGVRDGTCLPRGQCERRNGQRSGDCSMGFGECCRLFANCTMDASRVEIDEYVTVLRTPEPSTTQCSFKIRRKKDVCQIRLDFKTFTSTPANADGICEMDRFSVSNSVTVPDGFTTCGELRDQHMYLSFGSSDTIDITPRLLSPNSRYEIVMSQIPCLSRRIVPSYCLQYYNRSTDIVRSFDWPRQQQSSQQYTICVESSEQSKFITWRPCTAADGGTATIGGRPFSLTSAPGGTPTVCDSDWISINGDRRYCGETFPTMVRAPWKPYLLNVNFDERERPPAPFGTNPGFVTNSVECLNVGTNSGGIFDCEWDATIPSNVNPNGTCQCDIKPALLLIPGFNPTLLFGPPPDVGNNGFCFKYEI